ncbi:MAG: EF-hand domain-containing protein [bacterium]|nr:EF-hand domain-containing protein [bacterium]
MRRTLIVAALASLAALSGGAAMAQMPSPEKIIQAWDKNADGVVDKAEWIAAGRPEARFALVDTNSDGKVTVEELKAAMAKRKAAQEAH